mgnify:CR=1 FL=1
MPKMMQNRMCAPGKSRRGIGGVLRELFTYSNKLKAPSVAAFCFAVAGAVLTIIGPSLLSRITDLISDALDGEIDLAAIGRTGVILLVIYGFSAVFTYVEHFIMATVTLELSRDMRQDLSRKINRVPMSYFSKVSYGDILSRITNDVSTLQQALANSLPSMISAVAQFLGCLVMMFVTEWRMALAAIAVTALGFLIMAAVMLRSQKYFTARQENLSTLNGYIEETVQGQKVVKVFCHEEIAEEEFGWLNADLKEKQIRAQFFGGVMGPVMNNLSQLNYGLTACIGGLLCVFRNFDVGGLTVFLGFSRQFSRPINELSMQVGNVFSALAGAERVFAVLDAEPEAADAPDAVSIAPIRGEVVLDHVTFGYEPGQVILKDISLYAKPGQKIAFVGSTGAGKTTITNLINRFYDIQGGSITVDGVDVRRMHRKELRENIAMVLQDTHLFTGTVRENIRYGRLDATDEEVVEAAKTASAHSFIMRLPDGYDTMLEGDGANLSQGQRQLLNIARAAVSKAPILILDEATSSVDTRTEKHIEHGMDRLMADRTTFVIAHRLSTVRNANAIMVLEHGQIIERGDHEDLLAQKGRYFELYTGMKELE